MRRAARFGIGAGLLTGLGAVGVKVRRRVAARRVDKRARADEARRNLWPPVPVKPGAEARIEAEHAVPTPAEGGEQPEESAPAEVAENAG